MAENAPALVLGAGLNGLAVARSLGRRRIPVYILDGKQRDIAYESRYVVAVPLSDANEPAAVVRQLLDLATRFPVKPVLIFTSDYYLRVVSEARAQLSRALRLQVPESEAVDIVSDKARFSRFARLRDLPVPATYIPETLAEVERLSERMRYPVLLKPGKSFQWTGRAFKVLQVENAADLVAHWNALHQSCDDLLIQEVIEGTDDRHYSYCAYRTRERGEVLSLCVNKIRVNPIHGGSGTFLRAVQDPEMERVGREVLEELGYLGVGSVCFKKSADTGRPLIHEINGRLPAWHSVFQLCGMDLPYVMYRDMIDEPVALPLGGRKEGKWISVESDISSFKEYRRCGELGWLGWLWSYRGRKTCAEFALDDLGPFAYCATQLAAKSIVNVRKLIASPA